MTIDCRLMEKFNKYSAKMCPIADQTMFNIETGNWLTLEQHALHNDYVRQYRLYMQLRTLSCGS